jgi:hypothetical protein
MRGAEESKSFSKLKQIGPGGGAIFTLRYTSMTKRDSFGVFVTGNRDYC